MDESFNGELIRQLPNTGGGFTNVAVVALFLIAIGAVLFFGARRHS